MTITEATSKMTVAEITSEHGRGAYDRDPAQSFETESHASIRRRVRIIPFLITLAAVVLAGPLGWGLWSVYMEAPWTRDGAVRAYVVTMAPEVSGRIAEMHVADNQLVHKGDLLMVIDPTNYKIAVSLAEAAVAQAEASAQNAQRQADRRRKLNNLAVSLEEQQTFDTAALAAKAQLQQAQASLNQAKVNLERTQVRSPVNGHVTNLLTQLGDYVQVGEGSISLVDSDSFWIDGYFEETNLGSIKEGDPASIKLMSYTPVVHGHVGSIARGITVPNAQPSQQGLASVNPIFTWVRLAQRIPVRVQIDEVPSGVILAAGMTATVQIDEPRRSPTK
jgi:RND family efflux transporter MFP subunit